MAVTTIVDEDMVKDYLGKSDSITAAEQAALDIIWPRTEAAVRRFMGTDIVQTTYTHFYPRANPFDLRANFAQRYGEGNEISWRGRRVDHVGTLRMDRHPVRSITTIHEDEDGYGGQGASAFPDTSLLTSGTDYYVDWRKSGYSKSGNIVRVGRNWPASPQSIKVVYVAGWSAAELNGDVTDPELDASDIQLAVLAAIGDAFNEALAAATQEAGDIKAEKIGDYSVTFETRADIIAAQKGARRALHGALPLEAQGYLRPFRRRTVFQ